MSQLFDLLFWLVHQFVDAKLSKAQGWSGEDVFIIQWFSSNPQPLILLDQQEVLWILHAVFCQEVWVSSGRVCRVLATWNVLDDKIKGSEEWCPAGLSVGEVLSSHKMLQVCVIQHYNYWILQVNQPHSPLHQCFHHSSQFLIMTLPSQLFIIPFLREKGNREEADLGSSFVRELRTECIWNCQHEENGL